MQNEVKVSVNLQVALRLDGDAWVGYCPSLDMASQGDTEEEALNAVKEAVELWFESCLERGVLAQALEESGFKRVIHSAVLPSGLEAAGVPELAQSHSTAEANNKQISIELPAYIADAITSQVNAPH